MQNICYNINNERSNVMIDEKKTAVPAASETAESKPGASAEPSAHTWVDDMKQELEDYIEEQGIYIRQ